MTINSSVPWPIPASFGGSRASRVSAAINCYHEYPIATGLTFKVVTFPEQPPALPRSRSLAPTARHLRTHYCIIPQDAVCLNFAPDPM
ncbi:hypothetical protein PM082_001370 [Marasmius tenuissimus]|nr:hypothetical protein PM082_001370 [Marasmius tenuissimus]